MHCTSIRISQRIYISDRTHSIPLHLPNMCITQPLPAMSVVYIQYSTPLQLTDCLTEQGERLGETHVWKTQGGAVPSINIYSLAETQGSCMVPCTKIQEQSSADCCRYSYVCRICIVHTHIELQMTEQKSTVPISSSSQSSIAAMKNILADGR